MRSNLFMIWLIKKMNAARWRYENANSKEQELIEMGAFTAYQNVYLKLKGKDIEI